MIMIMIMMMMMIMIIIILWFASRHTFGDIFAKFKPKAWMDFRCSRVLASQFNSLGCFRVYRIVCAHNPKASL